MARKRKAAPKAAPKAAAKPAPAEAPEDDDEEDVQQSEILVRRAEELKDKKSIIKQVLDFGERAEKGFGDQADRANDIMDYWDLFNCTLTAKQFYTGNSKIFIPIIYNAVNARVTRFVNQIFPPSGRTIDVTTDVDKPNAITALLQHYVRKTELRTKIMPALLRCGDVEGQYNLYLDWTKNERHVVYRVPKQLSVPIDDDADDPLEVELEGDEYDDIEEETIEHAYPGVEVLSDADVLVLPHNSDSVEGAIAKGGCAVIIRRWSKEQIEKLAEEGDIDQDVADMLCDEFPKAGKSADGNNAKKNIDSAGIHSTDGGSKFALVYEIWGELKWRGKRRLCKIYYCGGETKILSARRNPNWSDKLPLISVPLVKKAGVFKGESKIKYCADLQYAANDAVNEGMDSAAYALMPIVMTDPMKNPRTGSMVLSMAAIWETNPNDTQFAKFPDLWKEAFDIVSSCKMEILQTLSVSPASFAQQAAGGKKKLSQAELAAETQIDILSTADACTVLEGGVLTPVLKRWLELDHQHRDDYLTVRQFGQMGIDAFMERIPPVQMHRRYEFRWVGVESAKNAQAMQMKISWMNVLRGIPPQQLPGHQIDLVPLITEMTEQAFGPRLAAQVFKDMRKQLTIDAKLENEFLGEGLDLAVHPMDEDPQHMEEHFKVLQQTGDPHGTIRVHIMRHRMQQEAKAQQMAQQPPGGQPGTPGGAGPGVPGAPRPGATPGQNRGGQNPPGAVHQDRLVDAGRVPRR